MDMFEREFRNKDRGSMHGACMDLYQAFCVYIMTSILVYGIPKCANKGRESLTCVISWALFLLLVCLV